MAELPHQADKSDELVPSAALKFVKGATKQSRKPARGITVVDIDRPSKKVEGDERKSAPTERSNSKPSRKPREKVEAATTRPVYEPFSTRLRADLKRQLKKLSHQREDAGHRDYKIQHLVERAIQEWLAKQDLTSS